MKTIQINIYKFDELTEIAQKKVLNVFHDINVTWDWWQSVYEDAACIGLKIEAFDLNQNTLRLRLIHGVDFHIVQKRILDNHGKNCDTYKIAENMSKLSYEESISKLSQAYLDMLKKHYEYLLNEETVKDTIRANDYHFLLSGQLFSVNDFETVKDTDTSDFFVVESPKRANPNQIFENLLSYNGKPCAYTRGEAIKKAKTFEGKAVKIKDFDFKKYHVL